MSADAPQYSADRQPILSVSQFSAAIKELLETVFPSVWITGEISNFSRPQSGHCYFTLKDEGAQLKAVMWRNAASRLRFDLADGMEVVCRGGLDLYAPRGTYQIVVQQIEPRGMGALELALRRLRDKLQAEGLFDPARKRPLPRFPRRVAFVTSPTGAAVRDFLEVLKRRWRGVDVLIIPARVQGAGAAVEIARGIELANQLEPPLDVLVVGRGGGSLEDLWAFNEEVVVRAIHASRVPVISAVGHEIDITLADLVADVRALTPSEAAERIAPAADEMVLSLRRHQQRLLAGLQQRAAVARMRLDALSGHRVFRKPLESIRQLEQRLDEVAQRGGRAIRQHLANSDRRLGMLAAKLESLSPLGVLARGYTVTQRLPSRELLTQAETLSVGDQLLTRFASGEAISRVEAIVRETTETAEPANS